MAKGRQKIQAVNPPKIRATKHASFLNFLVWICLAPFILIAEKMGLILFHLYFVLERIFFPLQMLRTSILLPLLNYSAELMVDCFHMIIVPICRFILKPYIVDPIKKDYPISCIKNLYTSFIPLANEFKSIQWLAQLSQEAYHLCFEDQENLEDIEATPRHTKPKHPRKKLR